MSEGAGTADRSDDRTRTDGGTADTAPRSETVSDDVQTRFDRIAKSRRRRWIGISAVVAVVGYMFINALQAVEWFDANLTQYLPTFAEALRDFFPFLVILDGFPFIWIDWSGFGQYWAFITEQNLIYDDEFFADATSLVDYPITLLTGPGGPLGVLGVAGETLAMGIAGTLMGLPFALLFGVLGSGRVTRFPFNFIFRGTMSAIRAIPALIWALIFVPLGGIGATTATLAIATDTIGNLGRLYTDELEEIEDGPIEAIETAGGDKRQVVTFGMLSQVSTPFIAWTLYVFEINVRIAVTLGIIGGGGLGQVLVVQEGLFAYTNMMATILVILVLIISVELFSQRLRARIRGDEPTGFIELLKGFPRRMAESALK
ncbi:phosphonate ABC transporter, permease protein PhnE [Salinadaptatus halalkaliphilus]|uniref:Phosphonate ABC transporter, permease protein PhnE n=1 Tax=Salinadaptatus halalkaliphilus TaxID=2419781 RepID=A0A4S3TQF8_9EURY|nr:ABC transporter permease subunit [Salinadaptatus halalkaliphilus]THE66634.1 phosphonate ABC transporter, permease protein PhnE [Salinadaptatus halalkaliphilus]